MNWDVVKAGWTQMRGRIRMQWGRLTDDHLEVIEGRRDLLVGKLQETYGVTEEEADRQVKAWEDAEFERDDPSGSAVASRAV